VRPWIELTAFLSELTTGAKDPTFLTAKQLRDLSQVESGRYDNLKPSPERETKVNVLRAAALAHRVGR